MSILTSASSSSVSRGYDYYKNKKVNNVKQLNDHEFEGYVDGSFKNPYYVKIDIEHPKKSYCDCPHANGNITCKHMTALYFELFPNEVDDYEAWLNSEYDDEDEYDDYYESDYYYDDDDDYDDYRESSNFEKPLFFDIVLEKYVNDLSLNELKENLLTELRYNEKRTFELYIKDNYKKYLKNNNGDFSFLDKLNKKIQNLTGYYDYNYNDFDKVILSINEKKKIKELYKNELLQSQIDKLLLNEKLSVYSDYKWIAKFYKSNKNNEEIVKFTKTLENYLNSLKHYSIKNSVPKANILIAIYLLNDFSIYECANSLLKNAKYFQYVEYIIEHNNNVLELYKKVIKLIENNYLKNKMYIPDLLYRFVMITDFENKEIVFMHDLYSFLCLGHSVYLRALSRSSSQEKIIQLVENKTKDIFLLIKLYEFYDEKEKLWNLLIDGNYRYLLLDNIDVLKDKYNDELYNHFINEFYNILKEGKNRDVYHKASKYINAIFQLNNGCDLVNKILTDLRKSDYQKCSALFDEINNAIKR